MAEQESLQLRLARFGEIDERIDISLVFTDILHVEALAIGFAAAAQIDGVNGIAVAHELIGRPLIVGAVCVEAVAERDDSARRAVRAPGSHKETSAFAFDVL